MTRSGRVGQGARPDATCCMQPYPGHHLFVRNYVYDTVPALTNSHLHDTRCHAGSRHTELCALMSAPARISASAASTESYAIRACSGVQSSCTAAQQSQ